MLKLNETFILDVKDKSLVNTFKYPAGELQVRLTERGIKEVINGANLYVNIMYKTKIQNSDDVMELILLKNAVELTLNKEYADRHTWAHVCHTWDSDRTYLYVPYLPYSRADRAFVPGDSIGKAVFINLLQKFFLAGNIITFDSHSMKFSSLYFDINPKGVIRHAIDDVKSVSPEKNPEINIVFPDAGASERYAGFVGHPFLNGFIYSCEKKRDPVTGKFLGFNVPKIHNPNIPTIIIDDICDGGGTFLGIAENLGVPRENLILCVSHGIFSKGLDDLSKFFGKIYTTDSLDAPLAVEVPEDFELNILPIYEQFDELIKDGTLAL